MSEEEKFNELLNSKLSERDFPFDELNWDEAERLIERQERKEKTARFALVFIAGIVVGVLILLPFMHITSPENIIAHSNTSPNTSGINVPLPVTGQPAKTTDITIQKEQQKTVSSTPGHNNHAGVPPAFVKKDTHSDIYNTPAGTFAATNKQYISTPPVSRIKEPAQLPVKSNVPATVASIQPAAKADAESENKSPANNQPPSQEGIHPVSNNTPAIPVTDNKAKQSNPGNAATAGNNSSPATPAASIKKIPSNATATNNTTVAGNDDNGIRHPNAAPPETEVALLPVVFHNIFSVYAGGTYSFGWVASNDLATKATQGNGITPWAGINYTHYFTAHISASLGIGYAEITGLNSQYTSSVIQYGFGSSENATTVTPQRIYYMAFPFKVQYDIDSKNLFGIGCNYLLMMTTYSVLTTYKETDFTTVSSTSEKQNGYTQGFSNSDWQLTFSYTRMLMSRLGITAEYYRDLDYIENNTILNLNQSRINSGFRMVLSYQILK